MATPDMAELANQAYDAYGAMVNYKNYRGEQMPGYGDLPLEIQRAWQAAVGYVVHVVTAEDPTGAVPMPMSTAQVPQSYLGVTQDFEEEVR